MSQRGSARWTAADVADQTGRTEDGFEPQFGTNHLGHFALTGLVLGSLLRSDGSLVQPTRRARDEGVQK
jgi:NAD(P)-dependent dehydrogenase (short-subunit alcohol dehydrogenase family)